jgi:hypothetical protein
MLRLKRGRVRPDGNHGLQGDDRNHKDPAGPRAIFDADEMGEVFLILLLDEEKPVSFQPQMQPERRLHRVMKV